MAHLTWNLARNLKLSDRKLFEQIKYVTIVVLIFLSDKMLNKIV